MTPQLTNTAGESEREARSRRANAVEVVFFAIWIIGVLWAFCFAFGILPGNVTIRNSGTWPLFAALVWSFVLSPLWHRDSAESLGIGSPVRAFQLLRDRKGWGRWRLVAAMVLLYGVLSVVAVMHWPDTARMFKMSATARAWNLTPEGLPKMYAFCAVMSAVIVLGVVRWDNLVAACRAIAAVGGVLILYMGAAAVLNHGGAAFSKFDLRRFPLEVLAYACWGTFQQFCFTAYMSARLRKSVPPGVRRVMPANAHVRVLLGGVAFAVVLGPVVWWSVWGVAGEANMQRLLACMLFAAPAGAAWLHFYLRDRRRMIVATLSGLFFGMIHVDSYGLVMVTTGLGTIFGYLYMEDRTRNLVAIGLTHGLLGTTFGKFFNNEAAGALKVGYRVGPWNVEHPSYVVLIVPMLFLLILLATLGWVTRTGFFGRRVPQVVAARKRPVFAPGDNLSVTSSISSMP